jgi:transcriptional repressor NrdR
VVIVKKNGRRELFSRDKVAVGIYRALEKRPVPVDRIEDMISQVERDVRSCSESEIPSSRIGELVMSKLIGMDEVAYVRFASVYRSFDRVDDFADELKKLKARVLEQ